jgi:hypothetical protein
LPAQPGQLRLQPLDDVIALGQRRALLQDQLAQLLGILGQIIGSKHTANANAPQAHENSDAPTRVVVPHQPGRSGRQVRSGRRQSMPSSSIDSCASLSATVVPLDACGHTK